MNWSDVNPKWPNQKITLYGAGSDSGTFDYFTEAVIGKAKASRGDYTASEDDNVLVQGIENDANSLGYIPFAYYAPHADKMKALGVDERQRLREALSRSRHGRHLQPALPSALHLCEQEGGGRSPRSSSTSSSR